ncbi:uncharacterized protein [Aegilops tauschii subsp. strangulata]
MATGDRSWVEPATRIHDATAAWIRRVQDWKAADQVVAVARDPDTRAAASRYAETCRLRAEGEQRILAKRIYDKAMVVERQRMPALPVDRVREVGEGRGEIRRSPQGAEMGGHAWSDSIGCAAAKHLVLAAVVDSGLSSAGVQVATPPGSPMAYRRGSDARSRRASPSPMSFSSPVRRAVGRRVTARRALQVSEQLAADPTCPVLIPLAGVVVATLQKASPPSDPHQEGPGRGQARVRPIHSRFSKSNLVWVRKDKFISGEFTEADCHPVGNSDRLTAPKFFSFSQDYWARKSGKIPFASIVKMAGGGRDASNRGGRYGSGRDRNGRPLLPLRRGRIGPLRRRWFLRRLKLHRRRCRSTPSPHCFPVGYAQSMMQAGGRMYGYQGG